MPNRIRIQRIGADELRGQMLFICADTARLSSRDIEAIVSRSLVLVGSAIAEQTVTSFIVYVESNERTHIAPKDYSDEQYGISGHLSPLPIKKIRDINAEKLRHMDPEWRAAGNVSTHPPQFLNGSILAILIGSALFLAEAVDLFLEREGVLRKHTIEILKMFTCFVPLSLDRDFERQNCLHLLLASDVWYEGNFNELVRQHTPELMRARLSEAEVLKRLGIDHENDPHTDDPFEHPEREDTE